MDSISIIKATIKSTSPLNISDGEGLLIDNLDRAYLPGTTIAGAFKAYLDFIYENKSDLFGSNDKRVSQSRVYIKDSFAEIKGYERRERVRIDKETGSSLDQGKFDDIVFSKGLIFELSFKIKSSKASNIEKDKMQIYRALKALDDTLIRLGGNKSNGLGTFKLIEANEINYNLEDDDQWLEYLKNDKSRMKSVKEKILKIDNPKNYIKFNLKGSFTTPLLVGGNETFELDGVDNGSIISKGEYIVPGSSFKGVLRARIDKIADFFNKKKINNEIFGDKEGEKNKDYDKTLSRVFVNESTIKDEKEALYNRIKIDKFTGGVRDTGLMDENPIQGSTEFKVIYRKTKNSDKDNFAIGAIALALRDLGEEDLSVGGGFSLGRGRFKASNMTITHGDEEIQIDFNKKTISNKEKLDMYVKSVNTFNGEVNHGE